MQNKNGFNIKKNLQKETIKIREGGKKESKK